MTLCKDKHNGPMTSTKELDKLVKKIGKNEKLLNTSLNLEIRLRKLTLTNITTSCPLFRQAKISIDQTIKNLRCLIECQFDMKVLAEMNDLEEAIREERNFFSAECCIWMQSHHHV